MKIDYSKAMSIYELVALILSVVAIFIPLIQLAWSKWIVKPVLKHISTGRASLFCNRSGSYLSVEGVFEAVNKPITVKKVSIKIIRNVDEKKLNLNWSTFISPVSQNISGNYSSITETAHPFRVEQDSVTCAFIEFSDMYNSSERSISPKLSKLYEIYKNFDCSEVSYIDALEKIKSKPEYNEAKQVLEKALFWEIGEYKAIISAEHNEKITYFQYSFNVSEYDKEILLSNISEVLIIPLKNKYGISGNIKYVNIELK